jgi:hypothetical protein
MTNVSIRRKILFLFLLIALVTTPWAAARSPQSETPRAAHAVEDVPFFGNFWRFLRSVWEKEGCNIDPNGRCVVEPTQTAKIGCNIDPNGHCVVEPAQTPPLQPKAGCNIDPWGRCIP